jgi:hypothetical protein
LCQRVKINLLHDSSRQRLAAEKEEEEEEAQINLKAQGRREKWRKTGKGLRPWESKASEL